MKNLFLAIAIFLYVPIFAQVATVKNTMFVRLYNLEGKKINKGQISEINDTTLVLKLKNSAVNIDMRTIGLIKTKRSAGNNVLIGSLIGLTLGAIVGVATADPDAWFGYSASEGGTGIGLVGAVLGSGLGAATIPLKNSKTYIINGDASRWKVFQEKIQRIK